MQTGVIGWWLQQGGNPYISSVSFFHVILSISSVQLPIALCQFIQLPMDIHLDTHLCQIELTTQL